MLIDFVADCGPKTGLGHVRRCLALAERLSARGALCEMRITSPQPAVLKLIGEAGFPASVLTTEADAARTADAIIYDGRGASARQLEKWMQDCSCFVVLDDLADRPLTCDIVINPNIYGGDLDYGAYGCETILTGPAYNLVAPKFFESRTNRHPQKPRRILVSLGGTDDGHIGGPVAAELLSGMDAVVDLVISPVMEPASAMRQLTATLQDRIVTHHGADMVQLMRAASALVCGGGVTVLEGLAAGLRPVVVRLAADQDANIKKLKEWGIRAFLPDELEAISRAVADEIGNVGEEIDCNRINATGVDDIASEILSRLPLPVS